MLLELLAAGSLMILLFLVFANKAGLFKTIKNRADKAAADANEALRDPVADGEAAIRDANHQLESLNDQRRRLISSSSTLKSRLKVHDANIAKLEELAVEEGAAEHVDNLKELLARKAKAIVARGEVAAEIDKNSTLDTSIADRVHALKTKIEDAKSHKDQLTVRLQYANIRAEIAKGVATGADATSALDRLEEDANTAEAKADSFEIVSGDTGDLVTMLEKKHATSHSEITADDMAKYLPKAPAPVEPAVA